MNRKGIIKFSKLMIKDHTERVADILGLLRFVPLDVRSELDSMAMYGISPLFDEVKDEPMTPEYIATVDESKPGHMTINVERVAWT